VDFLVTYTDADYITLSADDVVFETTGSVTGAVSVSGSGSISRTITPIEYSGRWNVHHFPDRRHCQTQCRRGDGRGGGTECDRNRRCRFRNAVVRVAGAVGDGGTRFGHCLDSRPADEECGKR